MSALPYGSRNSWPALFLVGLLACSGEGDTQMRTLASGRQIEVFRVFEQEGPRGPMLNYFYNTEYLGDRPKLEAEWADILPDAQAEAEKAKAQEIYILAGAKRHYFISFLLHGRTDRSVLYRSDGHTWHKVWEK